MLERRATLFDCFTWHDAKCVRFVIVIVLSLLSNGTFEQTDLKGDDLMELSLVKQLRM